MNNGRLSIDTKDMNVRDIGGNFSDRDYVNILSGIMSSAKSFILNQHNAILATLTDQDEINDENLRYGILSGFIEQVINQTHHLHFTTIQGNNSIKNTNTLNKQPGKGK